MSTTLNPPPPAPASPPPLPKYAADGTVAKPWYKKEFNIGRAVKPEELMNFSRQLSSFLRAGVPILDSLGVVAEENASKKMQEVIVDVQRRLRAGTSFGDAISVHPKVFPGYYIAVCKAAELTGQLDDALDELSEYLERDAETRREVKSALTYPTSSCSSSRSSPMIVMAVYVLPKFRDLYTSLHAHLPLPTRMLLAFTNFMANWWWLVALLLVGGTARRVRVCSVAIAGRTGATV